MLIPLVVLGISASWYVTRSWEPVNMPISLARGHIRAEFDINVESVYAIELNFSQDRVLQRHPCPNDSMECDSVSLVGAPWSVSSGGKPFAGGRGQPAPDDLWVRRSIGSFQCGKGHYVLDIDPAEDQSRLNFYEPHLAIYEAGGKANRDGSRWVGALSILALLLGGPIGASMIILATIHWRQEKLATRWKKYPLTQAGPVDNGFLPGSIKIGHLSRRRPRLSIARPFSRPSTHSLVVVLTYVMVWIPLVVAMGLERKIPTGMAIHLIRPGVAAPRSPGIQPLLVRVVVGPSLYIDSDRVAWEDFSAVLHTELSRRPPDWPVYVEGDPDLEWRQVAEVIDAIRGAGADVVLLTDRLRKTITAL